MTDPASPQNRTPDVVVPGEFSPSAERRSEGYLARGFVVAVFVGVWMAAGWVWKLDANQYLLLGVPLTILFQLFVARRPLLSAWVREAPPMKINAQWVIVSAALAALPVYELAHLELPRQWVIGCWLVCSILGAPAAAYAIQNYNRRVARTIPAIVLLVVILAALMTAGTLFQKGLAVRGVGNALLHGLFSTMTYFTVCFFLEEVTFRGVLDAYIYRPSDKRGFGSAVFVAFLWGVWHLPIAPLTESLIQTTFQLGLMHMIVGVPLALSWRVGGSLLVPAAAHAVLDGVRNFFEVLR